MGEARSAPEVLIAAIADTVVPADEHPAATDAGVGDFLATAVRERPEWSARLDAIALRIEAAASATGAPFAQRLPTEREAILDGFADDPEYRWLARLIAGGYYGDAGQRADGTGSWRDLRWKERPLAFAPQSDLADELLAAVTPASRLAARYDAIVIGSGAGGGVAAQELTRAGRTVLLVERGPAPPPADLARDHLRNPRVDAGLESVTGPPLVGNPRVVGAGDGEVAEPSDPRWGNNAMILGGGTRVYGAQAWRFAPADFAMASTYGVPEGSALADWPVTYDEMEPYYARAEQEVGVSGEAGDPELEGRRSTPYPMPAMPSTRPADVLRAGADALGLPTGPVPLAINSVPRDGRFACARGAMCVGFACPSNAKGGSHNTVLVRAAQSGQLTVVLGAQAARLVTDASGRVTGVELRGAGDDDAAPWAHEVAADEVVVAAGAVETARLLLNSPSAREPTGVGNARDQVGRYLQAHVYAGALGIFPDEINDGRGPGPAIATHAFRHGNPGIVGGGMLANEFVPTPFSTLTYLQDAGLIALHGEQAKRDLRRLIHRMQRIVGPVHEVTMHDSRVTVSPTVRDGLGIPVARLSGDVHPEDLRAQAFLSERAAEWLRASGAEVVVPLGARPPGAGPSVGQHQAGTCRMGTDPATSVTDPVGRVWGHDNVRIVDASLHVTNGGVNPVLTVFANAFRIMADATAR